MSPCLLLLEGKHFLPFISISSRVHSRRRRAWVYTEKENVLLCTPPSSLCARVSQFVLSCRISRSRGAKNYKNFIFPSPDLSHCWQWFRDFSEFVNSASAPNPKISLGVSERSVQSTDNSERGSTCARHTANNKFSVAYNALKRYFFSRKNTTARENECEVKYGRNLEQQTLH